ncbi:MAG: sugar ABC transporter permease [Lachnospiraceae bacterium]|nr:sugar ABC transporter permease [Lachnospiraceae bacterium]
MKRKKRKETILAWAFLLPSLFGVSCYVLVPFADVIRRSFSEAMTRTYVGIQNYKSIFENQAFLRAGRNTLRFLAVCIPLLLALSLFFSLLLMNITHFREIMKTAFLVPLAIPAASIVLLWKVFFHENGLLNGMLTKFGMQSTDFINSGYAFAILIFTYIWKNIGYDLVLWSAGLAEIPESLYEAAAIDGAGKGKTFLYITLPNLTGTFFIVTVLSFINSFKVFREAYLIAGDYPHESIYMLQHLFNNWFTALDIQKMSAGAVVVAVSVFLVIFLSERIMKHVKESGGER